ncbi:MAG: ABC transporter ATP-binding protein [Spirochaetia bacterium]|jgi:energy-coupling factor transport system ATP-binding protein|nr:ABC transporter ATP-binding protein [Spirochaetia bacterium]
MAVFLDIRNLSFIYPEYKGIRKRYIFKDLTFSVDRGEVAVFLAPPESGKTTLSRIITALVPRYTGGILEGEVYIGDKDVIKEKPYNLLSSVGIVFQNPEEQILTPEVESEIGFSLESSGYDYDLIKKKTDHAIAKTELEILREMNPAYLSGGEKRKLLFACLAASDPQLWILDETFEEIDPEGRVFLLEFLKKEKKTVLILTSKMLDIYRKYCTRFFLYDGENFLDEKPAPGNAFMEAALKCGVYLDSNKLKINIRKTPSDKVLSDSQVLLKVSDIKFRYPNSEFLLEIDDFYLKRGEVAVLLGRNGSGKSTFAKIISGLLLPEYGSVSLEKNGQLYPATPDELNRNTAYLFQNPDFQLFLPTVGEELSFGLKAGKADKNEQKKMIENAIALFRLESLDAPPAIMSYGARKRLQAAIYFLLNKKIVIIDEADSGLSFNDYTLILKSLKNLDPAPAILIISHDMRLSAGLADRILVIEEGFLTSGDSGERFKKLLDISMAEVI